MRYLPLIGMVLPLVPVAAQIPPQPNISAHKFLPPSAVTVSQGQEEIGQPPALMEVETSAMPLVAQLSDIQPNDWAFEALNNLVQRYNCITGYPDGTFRGRKALTRYEFAAGLNACLDAINQELTSLQNQLVKPEDLTTIKQLQTEFASELATLRNRVSQLENRTAKLEENLPYTTTVLGGEVIFALTGSAGGSPLGRRGEVTFSQLTRLGLVSTLTGKDRLRIELGTGNFSGRGIGNPGLFNTDMTLLSYQGGNNNQIELDKVEYRFAGFDDQVVFTIRPVGFSLSSILTANSPYFDAGRGALSRFTEASPLFKIGNLDSGVGLDWLVSDRLRLQLAYGTGNSNLSKPGAGIFGADRSALGVQLLAKPVDNLLTGIAYINAYAREGRLDTFTGSFISDTNGFINEPVQINAISGTLQWRLNNQVTLGTWGGWIFSNSTVSNSAATTTTYLFSLGISDPFGRDGDLLAFLFGQPPKLVTGNNLFLGEDRDTTFHLESFYRYQLTDNIAVTPGFFLLLNPEHNTGNNDIFVGTIRTVFRF